MSVFDGFLPASYKGAEFFMRSSSTTGGRKNATHEFAGTDKRYVEDLGRLERKFTIEAITKGSTYDEYLAKRDALIMALESRGAGILVHPTFGSVNVSAKPYTLAESMTEGGVAKFSLSFEIDYGISQPTITGAQLSEISTLKEATQEQAVTTLAEKFALKAKSPRNFESAVASINNIATQLDKITNAVTAPIQRLREVRDAVDNVRQTAAALVQNARTMGETLVSLINDIIGLSDDGQERVRVAFSSGDIKTDEVAPEPITDERVERESNLGAVDEFMESVSLAAGLEAAAQADYGSSNEINAINIGLRERMRRARLIASADLLNQLEETYTKANLYLDQLEQASPRVATETTAGLPVSILAYQLYGSLDNDEAIINLNRVAGFNPTFPGPTINVLTS